MEIRTRSLLLRPFRLSDSEKVFTMSQEPGLARWLPDQVYENPAAAEDVLRRLIVFSGSGEAPTKVPLVLGVSLRESGELVGHVGLSPCPEGVELGYAIEEKHQGKGLATETVSAIARWAVEHRGLPQIWGIVASENIASCKVLERAGFRLQQENERDLHGTIRLVRSYRFVGPLQR